MTDIVEQAARVIYDTENYNRAVLEDAQVIAQALADAGLLAQPARTVPTREQIAEAIHDGPTAQAQYMDVGIAPHTFSECPYSDQYLDDADEVLALLTD